MGLERISHNLHHETRSRTATIASMSEGDDEWINQSNSSKSRSMTMNFSGKNRSNTLIINPDKLADSDFATAGRRTTSIQYNGSKDMNGSDDVSISNASELFVMNDFDIEAVD